MIRLGLWVLERKKQRENAILVQSYQGHTLSAWLMTVDIDLDPRLGERSAGFCTVKLPFSFSIFVLSSLEGHYCTQPSLRAGAALFMNYLHELFGILLHGRFVSSLPAIYLFSCSFIWVWTHGHLFYTLGYGPILFYHVAKIVPVGSYVPLSHPHPCEVICVCVTFLFLSLQNAPGSSYMFLAPVLESAVSVRSPGSCDWRIVLETMIQVWDVSVASQRLCLSVLSADRMLPNTGSCACCTVRPNKLSSRSLEQRRVYCRDLRGDRWLLPKKPQLLKGFQQSIFKGQVREGRGRLLQTSGCRDPFLLAAVHLGQVTMFL